MDVKSGIIIMLSLAARRDQAPYAAAAGSAHGPHGPAMRGGGVGSHSSAASAILQLSAYPTMITVRKTLLLLTLLAAVAQ